MVISNLYSFARITHCHQTTLQSTNSIQYETTTLNCLHLWIYRAYKFTRNSRTGQTTPFRRGMNCEALLPDGSSLQNPNIPSKAKCIKRALPVDPEAHASNATPHAKDKRNDQCLRFKNLHCVILGPTVCFYGVNYGDDTNLLALELDVTTPQPKRTQHLLTLLSSRNVCIQVTGRHIYGQRTKTLKRHMSLRNGHQGMHLVSTRKENMCERIAW